MSGTKRIDLLHGPSNFHEWPMEGKQHSLDLILLRYPANKISFLNLTLDGVKNYAQLQFMTDQS